MLMLLLILVLVFYSAFRLKDILKTPSWSTRKMCVLSLLLLLVSFITTFLPMFYVYGNFGPARASLPFFLVLILVVFCWVFVWGLNHQVKVSIILPVSMVSVLLVGIFTFKQVNTTRHFAREYDNRVKDIFEQKGSKALFLVARPLPDSGIIPSQELNKIGETPAMTSYYLGRVNGINKDIYLDTTSIDASGKRSINKN
jgi:O-antigen/teichoic acid export membrane protein